MKKTLSIFSIINLLENEEKILQFLESRNLQNLDESEDENDTSEGDENTNNIDGDKINKPRKIENILKNFIKKNKEIKLKSFQKQNNPLYAKIIKNRQNLPTWNMMSDILKTIHENQVTIISGETGCGKSTQVIDEHFLNQYSYNLKIMKNEYLRIWLSGI